MGFNLCGGRPKNMKQGIYWVQRHLADQRRAEQVDNAARARVVRLEERQAVLITTYERLFGNVKHFFDTRGEFKVNQRQADAIATKQSEWESQRAALVEGRDEVTPATLRKFGTAGKNMIVVCARVAKLNVMWDVQNRMLNIADITYDFS